MKKIKQFITEIFQDERDKFSSNRTVGILCAITLCGTMAYSLIGGNGTNIPTELINAVTMLSFGALGLGAVNKIFKKDDDIDANAKS